MGETLRISWLRRRGCEAVALSGVLILLVGCTEHHFEDTRAPGQISVRDDLYAATAIGPDTLWAAGYFGAIYKTTNGGQTFDKLNSGTEKTRRSVKPTFVDRFTHQNLSNPFQPFQTLHCARCWP